MNKKYINIILAVICLILVVVNVVTSKQKDTVWPVIKYEENEKLTYKPGDKEELLLKGVTATDDRDEDITDSIIIDSITPSNDGKKATVVYAVKDKSNNITKVKRVVTLDLDKDSSKDSDEDLTLDGKPVLKLKQDKVTIAKGSNFEPLDYVEKIIDDKDDDLSNSVQVDGYYDVNSRGVYKLYYYVIDADNNISKSKLLVLTVD